MKSLKSFTATLICLIGLCTNSYGQYTFLLKNEKSPYDSAVAVRLDRYRMEGQKIKAADQLIDSLVFEIKSITLQNYKSDSLSQVQREEIAVLKKDRSDNKESLKTLSVAFDVLSKEEEPKWYNKIIKSPVTWYIAGALSILIAK